MKKYLYLSLIILQFMSVYLFSAELDSGRWREKNR